MKKIVFVDPAPFPYYSGGVETWLYNLINTIGDDYDITVVSPTVPQGTPLVHDLGSRVRLVHYKAYDGSNVFRNRLSIIGQKIKINHLTKVLKGICREDKNRRPSIVCLDTVICGRAVNSLRKQGFDFDYVVSIRGPHAEVLSKSYPFYAAKYNQWEKETLETCDKILANGDDTIQLYKKIVNRPISIMKNGVSINRIKQGKASKVIDVSKNDGEYLIISIATLIKIKGVYKIVDAIREYVQKYGKNIRVVFVGKGDQNALLSYAAGIGVDKYINCVGEKTNVEDYYAIADLVVCASGGSGLSMSMLEALASQKPIVAIDTPVYQQFNKSRTLNLVPDSPEGIALGFSSVVNSYEIEKEKAQKNIEIAKEYDWSTVAADFIDYIEKK